MPIEDIHAALAWAMSQSPFSGEGLVASARLILAMIVALFGATWWTLEKSMRESLARTGKITWGLGNALHLYALTLFLALLMDGALLHEALGNPDPLLAQRAMNWIAQMPIGQIEHAGRLSNEHAKAVDAGLYLHASTRLLHGTVLLSSAAALIILIGGAEKSDIFRRHRASWFFLAVLMGASGWSKLSDPAAIEAFTGQAEPLLRQLTGL